MKNKDKDLPIRKSVTMPGHMWDAVDQFQKAESITTEAEALRRVVLAHPGAQSMTRRRPRGVRPEGRYLS